MNAISRSFASALATYDEHAQPQARFARTLVQLLNSHMTSAKRSEILKILEIGCGTGFLTKTILSLFSTSDYFANDVVADCKYLINDISKDIRFINGDIEAINLPTQLDLVCSASTFQWLQHPKELCHRISHSLNQDGYLALSSFAPQHFYELKAVIQNLGIKQAPMSYLSAEHWHEILTPSFHIVEIKQNIEVEYFTTLHDLFIHLRRTGVNGNRLATLKHQQIHQLETIYTKKYNTKRGLPLSYNPIQIIAQKR